MNPTIKLQAILSGIKHVMFKDPVKEAEAKRRAAICAACKYHTTLKICSKCGCILPIKIRTDIKEELCNLW